MRLLDRFLNRGESAISTSDRTVFSHYEATMPSPDRSTLRTTFQDADGDANSYARCQTAKKARYLLRNSGIFAGIQKRIVTYVVGNGIEPVPSSSDESFNRLALSIWESEKNNLEIETNASWQDLCEIIFGTILCDGAIYSLLTFSEEKDPKIQLHEIHSLKDGQELGPHWRNGIEMDAYGRPINYLFSGSSEPIPASNIVAHFFPARAKQHFGVSIYAPVINTAHDIEDILNYERAAVKDACSKTDVIETLTGESNAPVVKSRWQTGVERADSPNNSTEGISFYQKVFGASARYIKRGDKYTQYSPQRPSPTFQGLMDFLSSTVCMPLGLPPSTLLQIKVGGADTRRDLAAAARVIESFQTKMAQQLSRIYWHVIDAKIPDRNRPKDWKKADWQYPASITADAGRMAQHDREDLGMGANTLREYCGSNGFGSVRQYLRSRAADVLSVKEIAEEFGLEPREVFNFDYKSEPSVYGPVSTEYSQKEESTE